MTQSAAAGQEMVRLNRHSWNPGPAEMILAGGVLRMMHPPEHAAFLLNYNPSADRFIPAPPPPLMTMNGQHVDTDHMLMCSKCSQWKPDEDFRKDTHRGTIRRGRRYYCRHCLSRHAMYATEDPDEFRGIVARGRPKKKRR